jgi:uncharacterized membrane protein YdbT with pleckstrin-like domain
VAFPRKLLFEGEEVVHDLRPHWWFFAGPAALLVVALVALVALAVRGVEAWVLLAAAGVVIASLLWFVGRYLRWMTTNFVLTTDRLVYRSGVLSKQGIEIPLERINTVFLAQTVFERILRSGDLVIESGGENGRQSFANIANPSDVQNEIYQQIELNQRRMSAPGGAPGRAPDAVDQLNRLDDLRQRGVITEAAFQAKKAKLLDSI